MTKILIYPFGRLEEIGPTASVMGLIRCLRSYIPEAEITLLITPLGPYLGSKPAYKEFERVLGVKLRRSPWNPGFGGLLGKVVATNLILFDLCRCSIYRFVRKFNKHLKTPWDQYDVVIYSNAGSLNEPLVGSCHATMSLVQTFLEWSTFRRPVATTPTDVLKFTTRPTRWLFRFVFNKSDILALRDKESYDYCLQMGLNKTKIHLAADVAFLLEPVSPQRVRQILKEEGIVRVYRPLIGFSPKWPEMNASVSSLIMKEEERRQAYVILITAIVDYLIKKLNPIICFIPNVTDDRDVILKICKEVKNQRGNSSGQW